MAILATVVLRGEGILNVTGILNLIPAVIHAHGAAGTESAKIQITGQIKGLTAGQYVLHVDQSVDLGNVAVGGDGVANVNIVNSLLLDLAVLIGRTLGVYAGNSTNGARVASGIIILAV